jgi:hypothetical protein
LNHSGASDPSVSDFTFGLSIGPQRCGTQHLRRYFKARSDVCLPADAQEIFYFDRHFQRGPDFYFSHFHPREDNHMLLELTTTAFDHLEAPRRVRNLMGQDVRLICPLRDPVERSMAVYRDYVRYGIVHGSIAEAVELAPQILFSSRYSDHLKRWYDVFDPARIHILFYEEWEADETAFFANACKGLGISYHDLVMDSADTVKHQSFLSQSLEKLRKKWPFGVQKNTASAYLDKQNYAWLKDRLEGETEKLKSELGLSVSYWNL